MTSSARTLALPPGAVLVVAGLSRIGETGDVFDAAGLTPAAAGVALIHSFIQRAQRVSAPLLNVGLLRKRPMRSALAPARRSPRHTSGR